MKACVILGHRTRGDDRVVGCGLRVTGYALRVTRCELRVAGCGLRVAGAAEGNGFFHRVDDCFLVRYYTGAPGTNVSKI